MISLQQNQKTRGWKRFSPEVGWWAGKVAQTMYTHVSKCKNNKIKINKMYVSAKRRKKSPLQSTYRKNLQAF
jgi:hypothetical protein